MQSPLYALSALLAILCASCAIAISIETLHPNVKDPKNPIEEVHIGEKGRVEFIKAHIRPQHLKEKGGDFPKDLKLEKHFFEDLNAIKDIDVKHHLVPSKFSGPSKEYNLVPLNKNLKREEQKTREKPADWFILEEKVEKFLKEKKGSVMWTITVEYKDTTHRNRPSAFKFDVKFLDEKQEETPRLKKERLVGTQPNPIK